MKSPEAIIGIEYHRQISYNKLMCRCKYNPKEIDDELWTIGETRTMKLNTYSYLRESCCDYERDEVPPDLNLKLVYKAYQIASRFKECKLKTPLYFMRKQILDGSICSGYQITGLIATGGYITLKSSPKTIMIKGIYLEQDSCSYGPRGYRLGRSGVPLIEITTEKTTLTAEETIELLSLIEMTVNAKQNLPKGPNTIRQDINISSSTHPRVQIKGVDKLSSIRALIPAQLKRQEVQTGAPNTTRRFDQTKPYLSEYMRTNTGKKRMTRESEITPPSIDISRLVNRPYAEATNNTFRNQQQLKLVKRAKPADLYCLNLCLRERSRKARRLYRMYLEDKISLESIKRKNYSAGCWSQAWFLQKLCQIKTQTDRIEFLKQYKVYLSRSMAIRVKDLVFSTPPLIS